MLFIFFFQAEDGIRDYKVTGVQTCALPIWLRRRLAPGAFLEAGQGNHRAADHVGKVRQRNGRGLAANPEKKRDRRTLVRADPEVAIRYFAGATHRRDSKTL